MTAYRYVATVTTSKGSKDVAGYVEGNQDPVQVVRTKYNLSADARVDIKSCNEVR
jgi:fructose 1,6-bisphosphatase